MDLSDSQIEELEAALAQLDELDPADLPEPAARLASLLNTVLEGAEEE